MCLELRDFAAGGCGWRIEATRRGGEAAGLGHGQHDRHRFHAIHGQSFPRCGTMDSIFSAYARLWKEFKSRPVATKGSAQRGRLGRGHDPKETDMLKTRNYVIAAAALLALSGTAAAETRPDKATRNIVV